MPTRLALLLLLLFGLGGAYLASFNTGPAVLRIGPRWGFEAPLVTLLLGAFLLGTALAILLGIARDLRRAYGERRMAREARRAAGLGELYHRAVDAQLAGRWGEARAGYEELLRREPAYPEAHARLAELARLRGDEQGALVHQLQALRDDDRPETVLAAADAYRRAGRPADALETCRDVLASNPDHLTALRLSRDLAAELERWPEALRAQERLVRRIGSGERQEEDRRLAGIHYEIGKARLAAGDAQAASHACREALRVVPDFLPALLALGDAHVGAGETAQALRVWERAVERQPSLPLLSRLEQLHRAEGRPTRMIAVYQQAVARAPESLPLALGLARVYFDLSMLDEAAEQLQKLEVRAPDLVSIHAYLGAIFERRGQLQEALGEYRRALGSTGSWECPHHCAGCGASSSRWLDRCPACGRWDSLRA